MPYATAADVRSLLAGDLGVLESELAAGWDAKLSLAVPQAQAEIETILDGRGYRRSEQAGCDWLFDEHRALALAGVLIEGGSLVPGGYDLSALEKRYERIKERVRTRTVVTNGSPVFPGRQTPDGQSVVIAGGGMSAAASAFPTGCEQQRRKIDPNEGW